MHINNIKSGLWTATLFCSSMGSSIGVVIGATQYAPKANDWALKKFPIKTDHPILPIISMFSCTLLCAGGGAIAGGFAGAGLPTGGTATALAYTAYKAGQLAYEKLS